MVQRLGANPGNKNYGRLGIMVQYFGRLSICLMFPRRLYAKTQGQFGNCASDAARQAEVEARSVEALQTVVQLPLTCGAKQQ